MEKYKKINGYVPSPIQVGAKYGTWTVIREIPYDLKAFKISGANRIGLRQYTLRCECGNEKIFWAYDILNLNIPLCDSCSSKIKINMCGRKINNLYVVAQDYSKSMPTLPYWYCICRCGDIVSLPGTVLRRFEMDTCQKCYDFARSVDLTNMRFGSLRVFDKTTSRDDAKTKKLVTWKCQCTCGKVVSMNFWDLIDSYNMNILHKCTYCTNKGLKYIGGFERFRKMLEASSKFEMITLARSKFSCDPRLINTVPLSIGILPLYKGVNGKQYYRANDDIVTLDYLLEKYSSSSMNKDDFYRATKDESSLKNILNRYSNYGGVRAPTIDNSRKLSKDELERRVREIYKEQTKGKKLSKEESIALKKSIRETVIYDFNKLQRQRQYQRKGKAQTRYKNSSKFQGRNKSYDRQYKNSATSGKTSKSASNQRQNSSYKKKNNLNSSFNRGNQNKYSNYKSRDKR